MTKNEIIKLYLTDVSYNELVKLWRSPAVSHVYYKYKNFDDTHTYVIKLLDKTEIIVFCNIKDDFD